GPITVASKDPTEWDLETLDNNLRKICDKYKGTNYTADEKAELDEDILIGDIVEEFDRLYDEKEKEVGEEQMREVERMILIRVVDNKWMDHIDAMDQLKSGIGLRALGQQDPAAAYSNEGFDMFELMVQSIKEETVKYCYNITVQTSSQRKNVMGSGEGMKEEFEDDGGQVVSQNADMPKQTQVPEREHKQAPVKRDLPKVGRNDPCPCGSGKKYKHCCGR
ncbi:MAG: SEC-C domain-containing protein, partial [Firmicutes bacterium]|nr:SEC-C domain-containing protein [Bacillota bacterium]